MSVDKEILELVSSMEDYALESGIDLDALVAQAAKRYDDGFSDLDIDLETAVQQMAVDDLSGD